MQMPCAPWGPCGLRRCVTSVLASAVLRSAPSTGRLVEVFAREQGLSEGVVPPLPFSYDRQQKTCTDGELELEDAFALPAPQKAYEVEHASTYRVSGSFVVFWLKLGQRSAGCLRAQYRKGYADEHLDRNEP